MKSILNTSKEECYLCGTTRNIEEHHIFGGPNRKISTKNGFTVFLCSEHHQHAWDSVHRKPNEGYDFILKERCQFVFELTHTREEFMDLINQNYLGLED